jgi:hypothetical protein
VITSLVSFGHCVVCPSSTYGLWLPLWYPLVIVSSVLPRLTACGYLSGVGLHKFHCNFLPWNIYIVLIVGSHLNDYLKLNFSYIVVFLCFSFDWALFSLSNRCRHGRDRIIVGFTTTYAISAFHHWCCEFESRSGRGVQHYVIMFVSFLRQVGGFLRVHRFPQPIKLTATI